MRILRIGFCNLGLDPLPYSSRVQKQKWQSRSIMMRPHTTEASPIANFGSKSISQTKSKSQGKSIKSKD